MLSYCAPYLTVPPILLCILSCCVPTSVSLPCCIFYPAGYLYCCLFCFIGCSARYLPKADQCGRYHVTGSLQIADKTAVKEMVGVLSPAIKAMGQARKIFLTPLARYWLKPCCSDPAHHTNYSAPDYLTALGSNVFRLREHIRDALYTRRVSNFRVLCPNRMLGLGPALEDDTPKRLAPSGAMTLSILSLSPTKSWLRLWRVMWVTKGLSTSTPRRVWVVHLGKNRISTTASYDRAGLTAAPPRFRGGTPLRDRSR